MRLPWICTLARAALLALAAAAQAASPAATRLQGFSVTGVSNRVLTPNGDGKNDSVVFQFSNPQASDVAASIYDVRGRLVASLGPVEGTTLEWDGRAGSRPAATGVYIYVLKSSGQTYRGTVVVIR